MKIGGLTIDNNIFLAPMAGVTDLPFRCMCQKFGCGLVYSEMVSAKGLYYKDKKTKDLMRLLDNESPQAIQIFGSDPQIMQEVTPKVIAEGADIIDINMGCPTPKIVNNGDGSALMKNPVLAGRVIEAVKKASSVPVTVKFRIGWDKDSINVVELCKVAEQSGADAVCVHGRTREQFYSGVADWNKIAEVKKAVKIPVIGNGDIFSASDAVNMFSKTECDAVMIGRGAEGNPFIFREIKEFMEYGEVKTIVTDIEKIECAKKLLCDLVIEKGENRGVKEARKHISWFIKGLKDSSVVKTQIFKISKEKEVLEVLDWYIDRLI